IAGSLSAFYVYIMLRYRNGWQRLPSWQPPAKYQPTTTCSIIIPARNEAENIERCLRSIQQQQYPDKLVEIIVIDDHSEDETATIVQAFPASNVQLLQLAQLLEPNETQSYKKKGIELAIKQATGELIVTTDADCHMGPDWLRLLVSKYEMSEGPVQFVAAPVNFTEERSLIERFQSLDFVGMMAITGAGIHEGFQHMCNGANLAYAKSAFETVSGFEGINHRASGDDMMLMQKIARAFPGQLTFVKHAGATVYTQAKPTWRSFIRQRLRWASKSSDYEERQVTFILAGVYLFCVSILLSLLLIPLWGWPLFYFLLLQLVIKATMDYLLLQPMTHYFGRPDLMQSFFPSVFLHWGYIVVVGTLANLVKEYEWKGRRVQ
ncbi:MAG: glycosyltransferase, partial [Bacteroidota bacterium]